MVKDNKILGQGISLEYFQIGDPKKGLFLRPSNQTKIWNDAEYFIKFLKKDKDAEYETLIPGRSKFEEFKKFFEEVKTKIEKEIPLSKEDYKHFSMLQGPVEENDDKESAYGSSKFSEISISSQNSSESNNKKIFETCIPRPVYSRAQSVTSSKTSDSGSHDNLNLPSLNSASKRNNNLDKSQSNKVIKIELNKKSNCALVPPQHRFFKDFHPKTETALSYRETVLIRAVNLTKEQMKALEKFQEEDEQNNKKSVKILGKK